MVLKNGRRLKAMTGSVAGPNGKSREVGLSSGFRYIVIGKGSPIPWEALHTLLCETSRTAAKENKTLKYFKEPPSCSSFALVYERACLWFAHHRNICQTVSSYYFLTSTFPRAPETEIGRREDKLEPQDQCFSMLNFKLSLHVHSA